MATEERTRRRMITKEEIQEQIRLTIQNTKEFAVNQVLEDLKRDIPEIEIQPEELMNALDINSYVKKTTDVCNYIEFLRFYLWYKHKIVYHVFRYFPTVISPTEQRKSDVEDMLQNFLQNEISNVNHNIKNTIPKWSNNAFEFKSDFLFGDVLDYRLNENDKEKTLLRVICERIEEMKDKYIKIIMECYNINESGEKCTLT